MTSAMGGWSRWTLTGCGLLLLAVALAAGCSAVASRGTTSMPMNQEKTMPGTWGSPEMWTVDKPTIEHRWQGVPAGVEVVLDQEFKRVGERALMLDLYLPEQRAQPIPAIVWISGGGWKTINRRGPLTVSAWLASQGYAIVGIEYRVSGEAKFPAAIEDCKAAVRWVRANAARYNIDSEHVGVWGDSAGGHLAELLGVSADLKSLEQEGPNLEQSSKVNAVCAFYPPADLTTMPNKAIQEFIGGTLEEKREAFELASPITHVRPGLPPHLLVHGTADKTVPFDQSVGYAQALRQAGVEVTLVRLPGVGHSGAVLYSAQEVKDIVAAFFNRHLATPSRAARPRVLKVTLSGTPTGKDVTDLYIPVRGGVPQVGAANAWSWNSALHHVDPADLKVTDAGLTGNIRVRFNPDPWMPKSGQPVDASYNLAATGRDDHFAGPFTGTWGDTAVQGSAKARYLPEDQTAVDPANCRVELVLLKAVPFDLSPTGVVNSELHLSHERRRGNPGAAQAMSYQYKRGKIAADLDVSTLRIDGDKLTGAVRFSGPMPEPTSAEGDGGGPPPARTRGAIVYDFTIEGRITGRLAQGAYTRKAGDQTLTAPFYGYIHPSADSTPWSRPAFSATIDGTFEYRQLPGKEGKPISYGLYLPPGYHDGTGRYPVLYHLHGAGCDESSDAGAVVRHYEKALADGVIGPMVIVFPNGYKDVFWADTFNGTRRPESEVIGELIPHIDATFRTLSNRQSRGLSGMSMGGFGATLYAAKFPDKFAAITSWDGAVFNWDMMKSRNSEKQAKDIVFNGDEAYFDRYSPYAQATMHRDAIRKSVAVRLVSGKMLKDANRAYYQHLVGLKIPAQLIETDMGHTMTAMMTKVGPASFGFYAQHLKFAP